MQRDMNALPDHISHEIDISKELDADYNCPKIDLLSHLAEQISRFQAWQQYSAKRHEQAHKTNLKDGWNASNHNANYPPPGFTFQHYILSFEIRELYLQALTQHRGSTAASCKVFPSGANLAAPMGSQSYVVLATVPFSDRF